MVGDEHTVETEGEGENEKNINRYNVSVSKTIAR